MNEDVKLKLQRIEAGIQKIKDTIRANGASMTGEELVYLKERATLLQKEYRILRGEYDLLYFAYEYFSEGRNPENESNLIPLPASIETAPPFHQELCGMLDTFNEKPSKRIGWCCPRGSAKTTYLSNIYVLHQIVYKKRHYIVIISETQSLSRKFIEYAADQLKHNEKLRADFGQLLAKEKQANEIDNQDEFLTKSGVKVQASSLGKQMRGLRNKNHRPDLVITDDAESSSTCRTAEAREASKNWYRTVVDPIGSPQTAFIFMGTMIHRDSLLGEIVYNRADYESKIYSAIISEPVRRDLWDKFDDILRDVENTNRLADAEAFYEENKEAMDEGAETLWNDRFPYKELMKIKVNVGNRAFASEYLNQPNDQESAIFKRENFIFYNEHELAATKYRNLDITMFWDIAIGKSATKGDYNAIITVGKDRTTGIIYVLDAYIERIPMHKALHVALKKVKQWKPRVIGVESVQAQYDQYRQLKEMVMKEGLYHTRVQSINPRGNKESRIETLETLVESGYLRFNAGHRLLLEQLELFPGANHDDGPDALQQAIELLRKSKRKTRYKKPKGM